MTTIYLDTDRFGRFPPFRAGQHGQWTFCLEYCETCVPHNYIECNVCGEREPIDFDTDPLLQHVRAWCDCDRAAEQRAEAAAYWGVLAELWEDAQDSLGPDPQ